MKCTGNLAKSYWNVRCRKNNRIQLKLSWESDGTLSHDFEAMPSVEIHRDFLHVMIILSSFYPAAERMRGLRVRIRTRNVLEGVGGRVVLFLTLLASMDVPWCSLLRCSFARHAAPEHPIYIWIVRPAKILLFKGKFLSKLAFSQTNNDQLS